MSARPAAINAAVVDDEHCAVEHFAETIGGVAIGAHIVILVFTAVERAVKRVDDDDCALPVGKLGVNVRSQLVEIVDEVEPGGQ